MTERINQIERVILVGVDLGLLEEDVDIEMEELKELTKASGGFVVSSVVQKKHSIDPATFIGSAKAEEIYTLCEELSVDTVIFNDELSGSQIRNLEKIIDRKIIDRTNLILDIFAQRANTNEGKLQVKLAQLKYRLPKLSGQGKYISRLGGGIGTRGPGEQKLETDRRHILREIDNIEARLEGIIEERKLLRNRRKRNNIPIVALAGYTNSGKSTLMNVLTERTDPNIDKKVFVKDMLFATLGTSLRRSKFNNGGDFLLIDTVGFVSKLPTYLVEAFKSTLEEIRYADVIVQVVDVSSSDVDLQIRTTNEILMDLDVSDKNIIYAFNKIDLLNEDESLNRFRKYNPHVFISAKEKTNIDEFLDLVYENLPYDFFTVNMFFDFNNQDILNYFIEKYDISDVEYTNEGAYIKAKIDEFDYKYYRKYVIDKHNV